MELNEKQFTAGFNSGYLFAKYELSLLTSILKNINPVNSYISGMNYGKKEFELEQSKVQLNEFDTLRQKGRDDQERE
ncbi:MAG: hypothetical protein KBH09_09420 [Saprospiraceae bacterium]|jgi:hypothetical protein|nr:hypothetical protein [Saprospiraceae bacterium]MBV6472708.1 hypothetical protein [Saprospiraceae bacterium]